MCLSCQQMQSDRQKMKNFICERIPPDGTRVVLAEGEAGESWADLYPAWAEEDGWDLYIETNDPEAVGLREVYEHFRIKEMLWAEWRRELMAEVNRWKVRNLEAEVELLRSVSDPTNGSDSIQPARRCLTALDIVDYYQGKISLRLAYQIMDKCQPVRAGKKRLISAESFEDYLRAGQTEETARPFPGPSQPVKPAVSRKRGQVPAEDGFQFFRFPH